MKRLLVMVCIIGTGVCWAEQAATIDGVACTFRGIDQANIERAQLAIARDVARIDVRQRVIRACATAAALSITGVALYQWLFSKTSGTGVGRQDQTPPLAIKQSDNCGFVRRTARLLGAGTIEGLKLMLSLVPTGIAINLSNNVVTRIATAYDHTQKPILNWEWMINEYTQLIGQIDQLKYLAASLDVYSPVLEPCNHIAIDVQPDMALSQIAIQQQTEPLSQIQELLRLKAAALKGEYDQMHGCSVASSCERLRTHWSGVVQAVEYCLAYFAYCKKRMGAQVLSDDMLFSRDQLMRVEEELIQRTNSMAQQLTIMAAGLQRSVREHATPGLLVLIYEYSNWVQRYGAMLSRNELLQCSR